MPHLLRSTKRKLIPLGGALVLAAGSITAASATSASASMASPNDTYSYIYGYYLTEDECIDYGQMGIDDHNWVNYSCYYGTLDSGKEWWWILDVVISYTT